MKGNWFAFEPKGNPSAYSIAQPLPLDGCAHCKHGIDHGNCAVCGKPLELSYSGETEDGVHYCSSDCNNPNCGIE